MNRIAIRQLKDRIFKAKWPELHETAGKTEALAYPDPLLSAYQNCASHEGL